MSSMKVDLHVHSKFSKRPSYWILQKLGCSESYVEPKAIYRIAREKGMRFVTITDHNTIAGSQEIAHLPDTFISEEVTTYFPDSGCKVHLLALDITEIQHEEISRLRPNIFDLAAYLQKQRITHVVAHPLFAVNDRLTPEHFEQLLLMFTNFELNGTRDAYQNDVLVNILTRLTPEDMARLVCKHNLSAYGETPWKKNFTGGSDDHSGFHIARTFTMVEEDGDLADFLRAVNSGQALVCKNNYEPKMLAHTLYSIAYQFYSRKFNLERIKQKDEFIAFVDNTLNQHGNVDRGALTNKEEETVFDDAQNDMNNPARTISNFCEQTARDVLKEFPEFNRMVQGKTVTTDQRVKLCYNFVDRAGDAILARLCGTTMKRVSSGNIFDVFQMIGAGGALYAMLAPYFISYSVFTKDRRVCKTIHEQLHLKRPKKEHLRVGHFTDTLHDINGVARTLRQQAEIAARMNKHLTLITCGPENRRSGFKTFSPIDTFDMPEYSDLKLYYPPLLKMTDYCYEQNFNRIHIATPGPVGLAALAIAHILQLPVFGTYHTSLPQYVSQLTGDTGLEDLTWKYIIWFYSRMDVVFVPSKATGDELIEHGISAEKIRFYNRGINTTLFHPSKRNGFYKKQFNLADQSLKLLYVGRVSKEKNMDHLVDIMKLISPDFPDVSLVVVGDGPYLEEMKEQCRHLPVYFTGFMEGEDLSEAYAGSDIFVFPSTTDTFGNVVLEAQASGVPVIVTDKGGPSENLLPDKTGFIVPGGDIRAFVEKISLLLKDPALMATMKQNARAYMKPRSFDSAFSQQWDLYHDPLTPPENSPSMVSSN